jgi:Holliday junction resolvasome RuvABC endonuclease subunit
MTTVLGIDHSLAATGLAVCRDGRTWVRTIRTQPPPPDGPREGPHGWATAQRHAAVTRAIVEYIEPGDTIAAVEDRLKIGDNLKRGTADLDLAGVRAVIVYVLASRRVPIATVHPSRLKAYATSRGNATKDQMIQAAARSLGIMCGDDNQADALWLAAMVLDHLGRPLVRLPDRQRRVATRIEWPLFQPVHPASRK